MVSIENPEIFYKQSDAKLVPIPSYIGDGDVCLHYTTKKNHVWTDHIHDKHQIILMLEPKSECEISWILASGVRKNALLNGQNIIYVEAGTIHAFRTGNRGVFISLGVSDDEAKRITLGNLWKSVRVAQWWKTLRLDPFVWSIIQVLRSYCYMADLPHPHDLKGHAQALVSHLLAIDKNSKATTFGGLTPLQLRNVEIYIEENLSERISVNDLAVVAGLKKDHFAHLFKTSTGFSPHRYIIALRLAYVRRLKNMGTMTNAQIAAESGFYDESHLYHAIKQFCRDDLKNYHGILPTGAESSNADEG